jgi:hypothetical protein
MGSTCIFHGRDKKYIQNFCSENLKGRGHLGDISINGRIILTCLVERMWTEFS